VISTPAHVQDYPARYSPQMGFEGANVHLRHLGAPADDGPGGAPPDDVPRGLRVQRQAQPSHLAAEGGTAAATASRRLGAEMRRSPTAPAARPGTSEREKELRKIPFFVRGKARRNTERYAASAASAVIKVDTLYEAKAHFSR
jgi:light-independent protochlorophyllide reductase subunit B